MSEPQTSMRQTPPVLRQVQPPAVRASWMAAARQTRPGRGFGIAVVAGVFLAFVGAFGTGELPLVARLTYWVGVTLLGALFGAAIALLLRRYIDLAQRPWLWAAVMTLAMSAPFTVVIWLITSLAFGGGLSPGRLAGFFPPVLLVTAAMTALNFLAHRETAEREGPASPFTQPRFLERLPPRLRGSALWAVEAEDHYLRLHTSLGQDLILMRLSDAVGELAGIEGARTHRSWWVAREAIADVRRGDGRATLTLLNGVQVPVSRAYARDLREAGWF